MLPPYNIWATCSLWQGRTLFYWRGVSPDAVCCTLRRVYYSRGLPACRIWHSSAHCI